MNKFILDSKVSIQRNFSKKLYVFLLKMKFLFCMFNSVSFLLHFFTTPPFFAPLLFFCSAELFFALCSIKLCFFCTAPPQLHYVDGWNCSAFFASFFFCYAFFLLVFCSAPPLLHFVDGWVQKKQKKKASQ